MTRKLERFIEMRCNSMNEVLGYIRENLREHTLDWWKEWALEYVTDEYKEGYGAIQFVQFYLKGINSNDAFILKQKLMESYDLAISNIRDIIG